MLATCFPSINNRMKRSLPKFGARCTINRAVLPLGFGAGVGRRRASVLVNTARKTASPRKTLIIAFSSLLIHPLSNPADLRARISMLLAPNSLLLAPFPLARALLQNGHARPHRRRPAECWHLAGGPRPALQPRDCRRRGLGGGGDPSLQPPSARRRPDGLLDAETQR